LRIAGPRFKMDLCQAGILRDHANAFMTRVEPHGAHTKPFPHSSANSMCERTKRRSEQTRVHTAETPGPCQTVAAKSTPKNPNEIKAAECPRVLGEGSGFPNSELAIASTVRH